MIDNEKFIISKIADIIPKMGEFDKGYLLAKVETLADASNPKRKSAETLGKEIVIQ